MAEDVASDRWGDEGEHKGRVRDGGSEKGAVVEGLVQRCRMGELRESLRGRFRFFRFGERRLVLLF